MATIDDRLKGVAELFELPDWEIRQTVNRLWIVPSFWDQFDANAGLHDEKLKQGGRTIGAGIVTAVD